jgi:queuine tRNA-ribosyltransferase
MERLTNHRHMGAQPYDFELDHVDAGSQARRGRFRTLRGAVETPGFMPVGTQGTVKGLLIEQVRATGAQMLLANTYHLSLRPGERVIAKLGGLHRFMGWDGPILTDSGGFQLYSLAQMTRVTEEGAVFRSHIDGRQISLTPERAIEIQETLGSDVAMVLDHVVSLPNDQLAVREAAQRTVRWARRCRQAARRNDQTQFAIVQGGLDADLRIECARQLVEMDFTGYAIGGLSVGEPPDQMYRTIDVTCPVLPADRPRYLMGVGRPQDLLEAIARGIDLFDCVIPTRNGRNALAFTDDGPLRLRNLMHERDPRPLEQDCPCPACRHSRGYLRHLFQAGEMLGPILLTLHNLTYYQRLMAQARAAISADHYRSFMAEKMAGWDGSPTSDDAATAPDQDDGRGGE